MTHGLTPGHHVIAQSQVRLSRLLPHRTSLQFRILNVKNTFILIKKFI